MKILLINKYYYLKGGADSVFFNTKKILEENGHTVVPFCTQHPKNEKGEENLSFVNAPEIRCLGAVGKIKSVGRFIWNRKAAQKLEKLIVKERPDVAHIHNIFNGLSLSILPVLKKYHIPVVVTLHDTRFICPSSYFNLRGRHCDRCLKITKGLNCGLHKCYQDSFLNSWMCSLEMFHKELLFNYNQYIDKYMFVSNRYLRLHDLRHGYFSEKGCVLYNFYPDLFNVTPKTEKGAYLFYYGRITTEKGVKPLIDVMEKLPDVKLKVAGTGNMRDELIARKLKNVDFLGFKSGKELFDILSNASFVVVPSEWEENNPMTIIEAYSYGKPVIGANIGGIPEIIQDEQTGYVFSAFNGDNLKAVIQKAVNIDDKDYAEMSMNARNFAENNFNPEKYYETLINIYLSLLNHENI